MGYGVNTLWTHCDYLDIRIEADCLELRIVMSLARERSSSRPIVHILRNGRVYIKSSRPKSARFSFVLHLATLLSTISS